MRDNTGVNKIFLLGRIETEPQLHTIENAVSEYVFTLVTREVHDKRGGQIAHLEYHNVRVPANLLPHNTQLCRDSTVHLEGKIHTKGWIDEQGVKRYSTEIIAIQFNVLDIGIVPR
ncbi:single-stranded DNA-binding protein [Mucilaginibacter conchicola]|uniref:Single-stranded DNA-binding protein n=1 Tax=Mucilaginibacter conchicola TaxID=2303333 RepID=A0A372NYQ3_9SPHI|nr:single-stranded DNA-binding protein [Mucilaginibacter conchicola]RFZ94647.1 single-stranded DNA-binding protein [Mucilaginibacter conchicola]